MAPGTNAPRGAIIDHKSSITNPTPRWRGFNLPYACSIGRTSRPVGDHFRWIAEWGFDYVRLPLTYTNWIRNDDPFDIDESWLTYVDDCVDMAAKNGLHIDICFHRGPGYCTNDQRREPFNLWRDREALDAFCLHWQTFARRYRGMDSSRISFNLLNEPSGCDHASHERVMRAAVAAIRDIDPNRLIILDGLAWGTVPCPELADLGVAQSCRAYYPLGISHFRAEWEDPGTWPTPSWPGTYNGMHWDRAALERFYAPWISLLRSGVGVVCGEGGCYNHTPHHAALAWLRDNLAIFRSYGIGYALWNLVGSFGVLDSGRDDVAYEEFHGHKLDRELLSLLQQH